MTLRFLTALMMALSLPAMAQDTTDTSVGFTVRTLYATGEISSSPFEQKRILEAQGEAACFVATQGQCRGARLEAALQWLHQQPSMAFAEDMELAEALLAHLPPLHEFSGY